MAANVLGWNNERALPQCNLITYFNKWLLCNRQVTSVEKLVNAMRYISKKKKLELSETCDSMVSNFMKIFMY